MTYTIFICHSYLHADIYEELRTLLRSAGYFSYQNVSIPDDMLVDAKDDAELGKEIEKRIGRCDVVLALTKPVANRRYWIVREIECAQLLGKPIIAITRRKTDNRSKFVIDAADVHIDTWRAADITKAIRQCAHEKKETEPRPLARDTDPTDSPPLSGRSASGSPPWWQRLLLGFWG